MTRSAIQRAADVATTVTWRATFLPAYLVVEFARWLWWSHVARGLGPLAGSRYGYAKLAAFMAHRELVRILKEGT